MHIYDIVTFRGYSHLLDEVEPTFLRGDVLAIIGIEPDEVFRCVKLGGLAAKGGHPVDTVFGEEVEPYRSISKADRQCSQPIIASLVLLTVQT